MKGIIKNMEKGTSRKRSDTVLKSCFRSRRVSVDPDKVLANRFRAVRTSAIKSCDMTIDSIPKRKIELSKLFYRSCMRPRTY